MELFTVLLIAVGLSMDAFAAAMAHGCVVKQCRFRNATVMALFFGGFQAVMPVIGWAAGIGFKGFISNVDHWVALVLLSIVGMKMIYSALVKRDDEPFKCSLGLRMLVVLAVATSIDALVVGITFSLLDILIIRTVLIIGAVTFAISFVGFYIGAACGRLFGNKIEILGGLILIGIGVKILLEHIIE